MVPATTGAQLAFPHTVPTAASWHPAAPLHLPVLPHVPLAAHVVLSRGVPPSGMLLHVPTFDCKTQLWQAPSQVVLQQTPSAPHTLLVQSAFTLQVCPLASLLPHWLLVLRQVSPATQSAFDVQVVRHDGLTVLHL
jgi:hypothetical protein